MQPQCSRKKALAMLATGAGRAGGWPGLRSPLSDSAAKSPWTSHLSSVLRAPRLQSRDNCISARGREIHPGSSGRSLAVQAGQMQSS